MLSHSVGRCLASAEAYAAQHYFSHWQTDTEQAWPNWLMEMNEFRSALAALFKANAAEFCPQANISSAVTKVIHSLDKIPGRDTLLLAEEAFPSVGFVAQAASAAGYKVRFVPKGLACIDPAEWRSRLTPDVRLALITHVHYNSGLLSPVSELTTIARNQGVLTLVDIAQSAGAVPIAIPEWNADFVAGSCVKWLCGGPGAGFLWVDPAVTKTCRPVDVGWFSHAAPFDFDIHNFDFADDALRFWGGTPSVLPFVVATNAIKFFTEFGVENVRSHNLALSQAMIDSVDPDLLRVPLDSGKRGGTLIFQFGNEQEAVLKRLDSANIRYDTRAAGFRVSAHIYNSRDDISAVVSCFDA